MRHWGGSWANAWGDSWGDTAVVITPVDGSGLIVTRRRKEPPYRVRPEEIARQQREDERYLAELEVKKATPAELRQQSSEDRGASTGPAVEPILADVIARAASAQQVIARARASSAEALAKVKADERRRTALLLLALD